MDAPEPPDPRPVVPAPADEFRPRSVFVLGVLSILFGSGGLICTPLGVGALYLIARQSPSDPSLNRLIVDRNYAAFVAIASVLSLLFDVGLIVSGIGLLRWRSWARRLSILVSLGALALAPLSILLDYLLSGHQAIVAGRAKGGEALGEELGSQVAYALLELLGMIYPAVLLYFMTRRKVARAIDIGRPSA